MPPLNKPPLNEERQPFTPSEPPPQSRSTSHQAAVAHEERDRFRAYFCRHVYGEAAPASEPWHDLRRFWDMSIRDQDGRSCGQEQSGTGAAEQPVSKRARESRRLMSKCSPDVVVVPQPSNLKRGQSSENAAVAVYGSRQQMESSAAAGKESIAVADKDRNPGDANHWLHVSHGKA